MAASGQAQAWTSDRRRASRSKTRRFGIFSKGSTPPTCVYAFLTRSEVTRSGTGLYSGNYASATIDACNFYAFEVAGGTIYTLSNNAIA